MKYLFIYFICITIITFLAFGLDKLKAVKDHWRIKESTLLLLATLGGSIGAIVGMNLFHHKTRKPLFRFGIPIIIILQLAVGVYITLYSKQAVFLMLQ